MAAEQTYLSVPETVDALREGGIDVSHDSVRRWVKSGRLKAIRLPSGRAKIRREDVEAILRGEPEAVAS